MRPLGHLLCPHSNEVAHELSLPSGVSVEVYKAKYAQRISVSFSRKSCDDIHGEISPEKKLQMIIT